MRLIIAIVAMVIAVSVQATTLVWDAIPDVIEVRTGTRVTAVDVLPAFSDPSCGSTIAVVNSEHSLVSVLLEARAEQKTVRLVIEDLDPTVRDTCWLRAIRSQ